MKTSPKKFIYVWQTSKTLADVVKKTGLTRQAAFSRGDIYKKRGIPLKKLVRSKVYDWEALAEYAAELLEEKP